MIHPAVASERNRLWSVSSPVSTCNLGTCLNALSLVTSVASTASACAAMRRSSGANRFPSRSSSARTSPWRWAVASSHGSTSTRRKNSITAARSRVASGRYAKPYMSSPAEMDERHSDAIGTMTRRFTTFDCCLIAWLIVFVSSMYRLIPATLQSVSITRMPNPRSIPSLLHQVPRQRGVAPMCGTPWMR